jgi:hypothetical protein
LGSYAIIVLIFAVCTAALVAALWMRSPH